MTMPSRVGSGPVFCVLLAAVSFFIAHSIEKVIHRAFIEMASPNGSAEQRGANHKRDGEEQDGECESQSELQSSAPDRKR